MKSLGQTHEYDVRTFLERSRGNGGHKRNTKRHSTRTYPSRLDFRSNRIRWKVSPRSDSAKSSSPETTIGACSVGTRSKYKYRTTTTTEHSTVRPCGSVQHSRVRPLAWNKRWNIRWSCWTLGTTHSCAALTRRGYFKSTEHQWKTMTDWLAV